MVNFQRKVLTEMAIQGYGDEKVEEWVETFQVMFSEGKATLRFLVNSNKETEVSVRVTLISLCT